MYIAASYINVKLEQDYADFFASDNQLRLIICDGIGEFKDSGKVAQTVGELFIDHQMTDAKDIIQSKQLLELREQGIIGGTTLISAVVNLPAKNIKIQYLGNGGIIQLRGDFGNNPNSDIPYRYSDIMIPHISPDGALTKHISNNSGKEELSVSKIDLKFSTNVGDILLFFSDGIGSLENNIILKDDEQRYWRYENENIQFILNELDDLLKAKNSSKDFQQELPDFSKSVLEKLKKADKLEDDAALGILISPEVLHYYKSKING
jgi:hypothetical protein